LYLVRETLSTETAYGNPVHAKKTCTWVAYDSIKSAKEVQARPNTESRSQKHTYKEAR